MAPLLAIGTVVLACAGGVAANLTASTNGPGSIGVIGDPIWMNSTAQPTTTLESGPLTTEMTTTTPHIESVSQHTSTNSSLEGGSSTSMDDEEDTTITTTMTRTTTITIYITSSNDADSSTRLDGNADSTLYTTDGTWADPPAQTTSFSSLPPLRNGKALFSSALANTSAISGCPPAMPNCTVATEIVTAKGRIGEKMQVSELHPGSKTDEAVALLDLPSKQVPGNTDEAEPEALIHLPAKQVQMQASKNSISESQGSNGRPDYRETPDLSDMEDVQTITTTITRTFTITSCPVAATDCTLGCVSTRLVSTTLLSTDCQTCFARQTNVPQVGIQGSPGSRGQQSPTRPKADLNNDAKTTTYTLTRIFTIKSCQQPLLDCTVGDVSTEFVTTTFCPGKTTGLPEAYPSQEAQAQGAGSPGKQAMSPEVHSNNELVVDNVATSSDKKPVIPEAISSKGSGVDEVAALNDNQVVSQETYSGRDTEVSGISYTAPDPQESRLHNPKPSSSSLSATHGLSTEPSEPSALPSWWLANISRQGKSAFTNAPDYRVFRNVKDFGAKGDGVTDDTAAINSAIREGNRCGQGCNSSTTTPALVYFPPGTYIVSSPIVQYYYTQLIGDAIDFPTLKATPGFVGMAVIDANPYGRMGKNWYKNQNNFFRQVRNFKIDVTAQPSQRGTGIHWQVAQATSLENIEFYMSEDPSAKNAQQGIFMENGSGGFMANLTFTGGKFGAFFGNQQFTSRHLTFKNCQTAIYMNWNWVWTLHDITIDNCRVGIDMANGGQVQTVGTTLLLDSKISNTPIGIITAYSPAQSGTNGTLILDNVDMSSNVPVAIQSARTNQVILDGNAKISSWVQGRTYKGANGTARQDDWDSAQKPSVLLDDDGKVFARSKPQYTHKDASKFISVKSYGAKGDGQSDDTAAIQNVFDSIGADEVVYFDHGAYIITDTIKIPKNVKVVGEIWPLIMAGGNATFKDQTRPKPVWQVGEEGDIGNVEIQDIMFTTQGPQPGAILMEFNVEGESKGSAALYDVHFRIGGAAGTNLQSDRCRKSPEIETKPNPECFGAFMLVHVTPGASIYMENTWLWVADHELDLDGEDQINIYNGRGILIENTKGAWLWGTASEHNVLSNYQISNARNVYMALIQTETAYFQGNPDALVPFAHNPAFFDPDFASTCSGSDTCARTWGLRIGGSSDIFLYGGGLYSFFDNYDQTCVPENNCQDNVISIEDSDVQLFGVSTKASVNMVTLDGTSAALDADNRNNFCAAIAVFESR